jgi:outer membrane protein assembly factor BamB
LFDGASGELRWRAKVDGAALFLAIAEDGEYLVVGSSSNVYIWSNTGHLLQEFVTSERISGLTITPEAGLIALGTLDNTLFLFTSSGKLLWKRRMESEMRSLSITPDAQTIVFGTQDHNIYSLDYRGNEQWHYTTKGDVWAGAQIAATKQYIIAGSSDHFIYFFRHDGQLLWKYDTNSIIITVVLAPDGRYAVAGCANEIFFFSHTGEVLRRFRTGDRVYGLAFSADGSFVVAGSHNRKIYLFSQQGECLWVQEGAREIHKVAITPNGRLFAAAGWDNAVTVFENLAAPQDFSPNWLARLVILRIRQAYIDNPCMGLACWFDEFDQALVQRAFALCSALLEEVQRKGYLQDASKQDLALVESRQGALLLCQGMRQHLRGNYKQARDYYEKSHSIQDKLHYLEGKGLALAALQIVDQSHADELPDVMQLLTLKPEVLGNGETALTERLNNLPVADQLQVVVAAKQRGYLSTLVRGLSIDEVSVQNASAAALGWLKPGPDYATLRDMLCSSNWTVRWQAAVILQQRLGTSREEFALYEDTIRETIVYQLSSEENPLVRYGMAGLLSAIGKADDTSILIPLLDDSDPDVRWIVVQALDNFGNRAALPALSKVQNGQNLKGEKIRSSVVNAIRHIEKRYPAPKVQDVVFCQTLSAEEKPDQVRTDFLVNTSTIHCIVTIAHTAPGSTVTCTLQMPGKDEICQSRILLSQQAATNVLFSWPLTNGRRTPGTYTAHIEVDGKLQHEKSFTVIEEIHVVKKEEIHNKKSFTVVEEMRVKQVLTCAQVKANGEPASTVAFFLQGVKKIYCSVTLEQCPAGVEMLSRVYYGTTPEDLACESIATCIVKTEKAGNQAIVFSWETSTWGAGEYTIVVTAITEVHSCTFTIIPTPVLNV